VLFEYHELSISADIHLSICNIGSFFAFNYNIKVLVQRWHTAMYDIVSLMVFQLVQIILQTTFFIQRFNVF